MLHNNGIVCQEKMLFCEVVETLEHLTIFKFATGKEWLSGISTLYSYGVPRHDFEKPHSYEIYISTK